MTLENIYFLIHSGRIIKTQFLLNLNLKMLLKLEKQNEILFVTTGACEPQQQLLYTWATNTFMLFGSVVHPKINIKSFLCEALSSSTLKTKIINNKLYRHINREFAQQYCWIFSKNSVCVCVKNGIDGLVFHFIKI